VRVLAELLDRAKTEGLSALTWTMGFTGLMGTCTALDPAERSREFDTWRAALNATPWSPREIAGSVVRHAVADDHARVKIALVAVIFTDDQGEEEQR
jgi:hypothetical protein